MTTILIDKNIMVPMRDGVKLATDIYRLESASSTPVLVVRTRQVLSCESRGAR
jgi:predicted acyl esterase